jgi:Ca2+-transporting ATPase
LVKEESLPVIRGKLGATQTISVWTMVVGDVVLLNTGDMVPADCLVITSSNLKVDEPYSLNKGVNKSEEDPVLLAGSLVSNGHCKAVICVVGKNSSRGTLEAKLDTEKDTPL